ncbi:MAG: GNAT family N-acetyltransferase [Clostridia bacterium]|nr:GNAT family N-acetyltransferase [Clostridia bacterium]
MIRKIDSFDKYIEFINYVTEDSCFTDPHYMYNSDNLFNALKKKDHAAFVVTDDNRIAGLFVWLIVPENRYIEMITGLSKEERAYFEMLAYLENRYRDYQMDFVFNPKNRALRACLMTKRAEFETEQQRMIWVKDKQVGSNFEIRLFQPKYTEQYLEIHNKETYWTGERVLNAPDRFRVFLALDNNTIIGYLDVTFCYDDNEPYGLFVKEGYENMGVEQSLLSEAIRLNKPQRMTAFVNATDPKAIALFESVGFETLNGQNSVYASYRSGL